MRPRKRCAFAVALIQISDGKKGWILRYPKRRKIQKIPIGVYPVYLMSTKNNLGTCCSAIAVKRFPLHVERLDVYPDEKF